MLGISLARCVQYLIISTQKIILFGSYAHAPQNGKHTWVYDPANGYISDYDILVIVNRMELVEDLKLWDLGFGARPYHAPYRKDPSEGDRAYPTEHYEITVEELNWLAEEVERLKTLVEQVCEAALGTKPTS